MIADDKTFSIQFYHNASTVIAAMEKLELALELIRKQSQKLERIVRECFKSLPEHHPPAESHQHDRPADQNQWQQSVYVRIRAICGKWPSGFK